ncbi:polysaccharide export protein [Photobacterium sp. GB-72]|uniref:polysaccharide export protein n=1 Tax=Photobacterium sp. GB-72 TaxID=2022105 RepID=UPI002102BEE7|nr:polysaccharide export protein [Photobacterium sp. GB-72]
MPFYRCKALQNVCLVGFFCLFFLSGCSMPGMHLNIKNKEIKNTKNESILNKVNIYYLDSSVINKVRKKEVKAKTNEQLQTDINNYSYIVGPTDVLNITVWNHPELTIPQGPDRTPEEAGTRVHADGRIFYPYVGFIHVAGHKLSYIQSVLTKKLARYIEMPQIEVSVAAYKSKQVYVTGSVKLPGEQAITDKALTLLLAINKARGFSADADWHDVTVTRNNNVIHLSAYDLIQNGDLTQNILLKNNDIIHIANNDDLKVFVMGEVNNPQTLQIDRSGMNLTEALSTVGGINEISADAEGVFVIRMNKEDKENKVADIYQLNMKSAAAMIIANQFELNPQDIIYVTASPMGGWNRVMAQVLPTITNFTTLTQGVNYYTDLK